ncbi:MAG: nucleotide exchange factor GrpE [Bdellovibrionales bacterium]|nr:nucleotide exchange factor GrpE [Bdellovibrionales bacterium]
MSGDQENLEKLMQEAADAVQELRDPASEENNATEPSEEGQGESKEKEYYERLLRVSADYDNFRKRAQKEKLELLRYGHENFARELLEVMDNFERALASDGNQENSTILQGVKMIFQQFSQSLEKFNIKAQSSLGKTFDPNVHEAMAYVESDEAEPNQIVEEHKKAYYIHDRLLRPALVSVAKAKEEPMAQVEEEEEVLDQQTIGISEI